MKFFHNFCLENPVSLDTQRTNLSSLLNVKFYPGLLSRLRSILIRNPQENLRSFKLTRSVHVLGFMIIQRHPAKELILSEDLPACSGKRLYFGIIYIHTIYIWNVVVSKQCRSTKDNSFKRPLPRRKVNVLIKKGFRAGFERMT